MNASKKSSSAVDGIDAVALDGLTDLSVPDAARAIAQTQAWVERAVIGLNLCPFAKAAQQRGRVRIVHNGATDAEALLGAFCDEARLLSATPAEQIETILLIHPGVLADFDDYNDFLDIAEGALDALGCAGVLQVASFHPHYRFAGTAADAIDNATNRSPWPILQLLREASVTAAALAFPDSATIYEANIATLRALGLSGWAALQAECRRDAEIAIEIERDQD
ncbi:MAG: DUF1415 domain-containing protein [Caldimonas sp.]